MPVIFIPIGGIQSKEIDGLAARAEAAGADGFTADSFSFRDEASADSFTADSFPFHGNAAGDPLPIWDDTDIVHFATMEADGPVGYWSVGGGKLDFQVGEVMPTFAMAELEPGDIGGQSRFTETGSGFDYECLL